MKTRFALRKFVNLLMLALTGLCALATVSVLFFILGYLVWNGGRALDWNFFTKLPAPPGEVGGGMANAIIGSAKLILVAVAIGVPVGFLAGVYLAEFSGKTMAFFVRYTTDLLNGVPSIVIGIFAYAVAVLPVKQFSVLAGGFALSLILIPVVVRSTEQFLNSVPPTLREGSLALGARHWQAVATVIVPAAARGILTGAILGVARIAGETAPLLFTSFNNRYWSAGWTEPASSLPVMIFTYAIAPYEDWHRQAWAAGLTLLGLVLAANVATRWILSKGVSAPQ
jgi:phosphate transport system permease protein